MSSYLSGARSARKTPQSEAILGREGEMVENAAGGFAFEVDSLERLRRFLILGAEGGTYYADQRRHVAKNVQGVEAALAEHGTVAVDVMLDVQIGARAVKPDPALWALARAAAWADPAVQDRALRAVPKFCRTASQLVMFVRFLSEMRGWGVRTRKAIAAWYEQRDDVCPHCGRVNTLMETVELSDRARRNDVRRCASCTGVVNKRDLHGVDWLAYQMVKYRQRGGWTHKRLIDLSHPRPPTPEHESLYQWALHFNKPIGPGPLLIPEKVEGFQWAQLAESPEVTVRVLAERPWLPWEAIKTEHTSNPDVWRQLIDNRLPMTALLRNLGRLTGYGVLKPLDDYVPKVCEQLTNAKALERAHVHPFSVLKASDSYRKGQGERTHWQPLTAVVDALDEAFYLAFGGVQPIGKRVLIALDVSGSMREAVGGFNALSAREAAACMAMVTARVEPLHHIVAFSSNRIVVNNSGRPDPDFYDPRTPQDWAIKPLDVSPRMRLGDVVEEMRKTPAGGTDVSLPMRYAVQNGLSVDTFIVYTDNESWTGGVHPSQALTTYRQSTGIRDARLCVVAMTATDYSVADPRDRGMLDVVGFDTAAPNLISAFARGEV